MENSSQSDRNDSDSFFAVNKLVESSDSIRSHRDQNAPIKQFNPVLLILLVDLINPLCLIFCALSTLSSLGLLFTFLLIFHIFFSFQRSMTFRPLIAILSVEILFSLILFVISILAADETDYSITIRIIGLSFNEVSFTRFASLLAIFIQSLTIHFTHYYASAQKFQTEHDNFYSNPYVILSIEAAHYLSISLISSTNISYFWFPVLLYFLCFNLSFIFVGHEPFWASFKYIALIYSILYSMLELYMFSFLGEYANPARAIGFSYIGTTQSAKNMTLVFSLSLAWTSSIMIMNLQSHKKNPISNDLFSLSTYKIILLMVICSVFFFTLFFPNFITNLDLIIVFFLFLSDFSIISMMFYPFLGIMFAMTFSILAITQYSTFEAPVDTGSEQMLAFAQLFGLFRYRGSHKGFSFCISGFIIFWAFGQTGRIKYASLKPANPDTDSDNFKFAAKVPVRLMKAFKVVKKAVFLIFRFFYNICVCLALPVCIITSLYAGFWSDEWLFQLLSLIVTIFLLLFLYTKWSFTIVKIVSGLILIYFVGIIDFDYDKRCHPFQPGEDICSPLDNDVLNYCWPIILVFVLSIFITREPRCTNLTFSPLTIALLYILIAICDFIYVFAFDICIFSVFYFFIGCLIVAFQCLKWNNWRTIMIMMSFISISIQLALYQLSQHDDMRNFFSSHVLGKIIDIDLKSHSVFEIVLLSFMIFLSSIVFRGVQTIEPGEFAFQILHLIHEISFELYFYFAWIFIFALSISNDSPSFIKFFFLVLFSFGSLSSQQFFGFRFWILLFFAAFVLIQFIFTIFVSFGEDAANTCKHIGFYYTKGDYSNTAKNKALGWEFAFMIISMLNVHRLRKSIPSDNFETFKFTKVFRCIISFLHFMLPVILRIILFLCASYNTTIFSLVLYALIILATYFKSFFDRSIPIALLLIHIYFLVQYLLYLGLPSSLIDIKAPIDRISEKNRPLAISWFEFLGIIHVKTSSLLTTWLSCISLTFYYQFIRVQVDYSHRYKILHPLVKSICNSIVNNCFLIFFALILILASVSHKTDGVVLLAFGLFYFGANLLFAFQKRGAAFITQGYIYVIFFFKTFSRLPLFVDSEQTKLLILNLDLPLNGTSTSTDTWIFIYTFCQILIHFLQSDHYKYLREKRLKTFAFRFIRDRQIRIIEKLDQDILYCKRKQEIDTLNNDRKIQIGKEVFEISNSTIQLVQTKKKFVSRFDQLNFEINDETNETDDSSENASDLSSNSAFSTLNCSEISEYCKQDKAYYRFYHAAIEPQIIRLTKFLCTSLPINHEAGVNVLTLESLLLLMKRCLSHYEKNEEYHLEEREKQFLISLPPSFALHFSSIYHLTDYQPFVGHNPFEIFSRYFCFLLRRLQMPFLVLITTIYLFTKPYIFALIISFYVIFIFCSLDIRGYTNAYRSFYVIVSLAFILQALANIDVISDGMKNFQEPDSPGNSLALIGLDPYGSVTIEIFLFIATLIMISDHFSNFHVFQPNIYYIYLSKSLPNFPLEYCYGIMDDPVHNLGMRISQPPPFFTSIKQAMNRVGLRTSEHHNFILILNLISLIILLLYWSTWESSIYISGDVQNFSFNVSSVFIWILVIDIVWQLAIYFYCMNERYIIVLVLEGLFFVYMYSLMFFYIRNNHNMILSSSYLFVFIRILQHIIASHVCYFGRSYISYRYPDFAKQFNILRIKNLFLRYFPFALEIQIIFMWIGKKTLLSITELLIVREMEIQLELVICDKISEQEKKKNGIKPGPVCRKCKGCFLILLIIILCFLPLSFLLDLSEGQIDNKLILGTLSVNFGSLPPLYQSVGSIRPISETELIDNGLDTTMVKQSHESKFVLSFPVYSNTPFKLNDFAFNALVQSVSDETEDLSQLYFYIDYSLHFERPTTNANQAGLHYRSKGNPLNKDDLSHFLYVLKEIRANSYTYSTLIPGNNLTYISPNLELNRMFTALLNNALICNSPSSPFVLSWNVDCFQLSFISPSNISLFQDSRHYNIVVFSSDVFQDFELQSYVLQSGTVGFITFYVLIVLLFFAIKELILKKLDSLWITRIENPMKYYKMVIAINMFKNAKDVKAEKEMCRLFIHKLKEKGNDRG